MTDQLVSRWFGSPRSPRSLAITAIIALACTAALAACAAGDGDGGDPGALDIGQLPAVDPPSGTLQASVIQIASSNDLVAAVTANDNVYLHAASEHAWYYKSGNYLLGIESFTQFHREIDLWIALGSGSKVAPAQTRIVGANPDGSGWIIPVAPGQWPARTNSVWVIGTNDGVFDMNGAPQDIPLGTEVFGSLQTYGGIPSTPFLVGDDSPGHDSPRIRAAFSFNAQTLLGGHSAGSSAARRIALDLGLTHVWLYGTPNYGRGSGAYSHTEISSSSHRTMVAEIINNDDDPVTNSLSDPLTLVSLAWGTARCHDYSHWDYETTQPVSLVCQ